MGYYTTFEGIIKFNKRFYNLVKYMLKNKIKPFSYCDENEFILEVSSQAILTINVNWKNYNEEMEKICFFILSLDRKAEGFIRAYGEEMDDLWALKIENGKLLSGGGSITYSFDKSNPLEFPEIDALIRSKKFKSLVFSECV